MARARLRDQRKPGQPPAAPLSGRRPRQQARRYLAPEPSTLLARRRCLAPGVRVARIRHKRARLASPMVDPIRREPSPMSAGAAPPICGSSALLAAWRDPARSRPQCETRAASGASPSVSHGNAQRAGGIGQVGHDVAYARSPALRGVVERQVMAGGKVRRSKAVSSRRARAPHRRSRRGRPRPGGRPFL